MKLPEKFNMILGCLGIMVVALAIGSCDSRNTDKKKPGNSEPPPEFPEFITLSERSFDVSIGAIPAISADSYQLKISGAVTRSAVHYPRRWQKTAATLGVNSTRPRHDGNPVPSRSPECAQAVGCNDCPQRG